MTTIMFFIVLFAVLVDVAISVTMCVLVYKDAQKRDLNPVLWSLIVILVPSLIGLIIYLIVRSDKKKIPLCPCCGGPVKEEYSVCPNCGNRLKNICRNCSMPLRPEWRVCPNCSAPVIEEQNVMPLTQTNKPPKKKNGSLIAIIILAIIVPALFVTGIFGALIYVADDSFESLLTSQSVWLTKDELQENYPTLSLWVKSCDQDNKNEVFLYADSNNCRMLIYVKNHGNSLAAEATEFNFFGDTALEMTMPPASEETKDTYTLLYIDTVVTYDSVSFTCDGEAVTPVVEMCKDMPDLIYDTFDEDSFYVPRVANDDII